MRPAAWKSAVAAIFVCGWGGNQFTPLLVMYRQAGHSALMVNTLLGAYVLGLFPGLLFAGGLSQRFGRRAVMIAGVVASLTASVSLAAGEYGAGWLAAGRFVTGFGVAAAMAVGTTWVTELSACSGSDSRTGAGRAALALTTGFGIGAGVAGALAQWGPAPMVLPYVVHVVLALAVLPLLYRLPETGCLGGSPRPRWGGVRHPRFRKAVLPMAPWIFGAAGVAYAIMPQLVGDRLGSLALAYSTLLTVGTLGAGALIQPVAKRLDRPTSARAVAVSMGVMSVGLALSVVAAVAGSPVLALVAALGLGCAYGLAVVSGLLELQRFSRPEELADTTGVYYAFAYLGFLLPALLSLLSAVATYPVLLGGLVVLALAATGVILRYSKADLPARETAERQAEPVG
ncbi:MFS transporter [Saccharomonospora glauca]|uniref:Major Facilitator Superfamily transporter n=1 Tax=Saccharomonospora glauca K62 TaxID=928724 RepID=I1D303_9PSEU|nr:MFS transporter [Saccharomonospora glauca]EIE99327.1 Major Facilitator Superfamily transporter [Saccharomonospora glauca K62]